MVRIFNKMVFPCHIEKACKNLGSSDWLGFDTYGSFRLMEGSTKVHPNDQEVDDTLKFLKKLC